VESGIGKVVAQVHLDGYHLAFDSITEVKLFQDQVQLGGQAFLSFEASLARGTKIDNAWHFSSFYGQNFLQQRKIFIETLL
jgi:hypothetical protein